MQSLRDPSWTHNITKQEQIFNITRACSADTVADPRAEMIAGIKAMFAFTRQGLSVLQETLSPMPHGLEEVRI